ncbi:receptor-like protein 7 [Ziziphus jujuba]|uniref:Receptor-like protein 7 n=1 Tax=Ziziphus jujuba TaxID=326968 RepID=A0ABM4A7L7_ZIZJJ|nr:receptor-like protein 7 [Ziziphus jujuba]
MALLSRLTYHNLSRSPFHGQVPLEISKLSNLSFLDLSYYDLELKNPNLSGLNNSHLTGYLPEFHSNSSLKELLLWNTSFSGKIPSSIEKLRFWHKLDFGAFRFSGWFHLHLPLCHNDDSVALLELNSSFIIGKFASKNPFAYPKVSSWRLEGNRDCCSWNGVECDDDTGRVVALDLSSSFLHGSINSTSTLFNLTQLQRLNLADNDFNFSHIPSAMGHLSRLTYLNLSHSSFCGQVPFEISGLSNLSFLDLSYNDLELKSPNLRRLVGNLIKLKQLHLTYVDISSTVPSFLANFSSLTSLLLGDCGLQGEFPNRIFQLPNLQVLNLRNNPGLTGYLPEFHSNSSFEVLLLYNTSFSGKIPTSIKNLHLMLQLDFGACRLSGLVPSSLGKLTRLTFLDLSENNFEGNQFPSFLRNLTQLTNLWLNKCQLTSEIPGWLGKLTQLTDLGLYINNLHGHIPSSLGKLTSLTYLDLGANDFESQIPSFLRNLTQLTVLFLDDGQFTGEIPSWFETFTLLNHLNLGMNKLHGLIPSSLGKLTSLTYLDLGANDFESQIPSFLRNLTQLTVLFLDDSQFTGEIPSWFETFTLLNHLNLGMNKLHGLIPSSLGRLSSLTYLDLSANSFKGHIPCFLRNLTNLEYLSLHDNELSGTLNFDMFLGMKNLNTLLLGRNKLSKLVQTSKMNATVPRFQSLDLSSSNLTKFPDFLRYQDRLERLVLYGNKIHGQVPRWIWNMSTETMANVDISDNSLTGFEQTPVFIAWVHLMSLDLSFSKLKGQLPIPPPSMVDYHVSNNKLTGKISPFFCNLSSLLVLDLSNNQLTGKLPQCLENFRNTLLALNMSNNHFHGSIPQLCPNGSNVRMIDLSHNQFQGRLPQMLANCTMLEVLNLGNNRFNDVFPSWLGTLPNLRLLVLRSNNLQGVIRKHSNPGFSSLHVFDISNNSFKGELPSEFFKNLKAMRFKDAANSSYLVANFSFVVKAVRWGEEFAYSITITNKGRVMLYEKIQEAFVVIDVSNNRFEGSIPESFGILQGLHVLNLSNNILTGKIPSSFGSITNLESLDLSNNNLSGHIPTQLGQLTFLAVFKVSYNHLIGPIPQMNQLITFDVSSYEGNLGLCGIPLPKNCESSVPPSGFQDEQDSNSALELRWMTIVPGYVSGLVIGVVIGQIFATKKHDWFVETFGQAKLKGRRVKRGRRRRLEENRDCCSWDGVEGDTDTGRVFMLDLSSSFLHGSINSTSTFFNLSQLQRLNLAYNGFDFSQIPSAMGHLSRLTYLNLSHSSFYGQVPFEISRLSNLSFLALSYNDLVLKSPNLSSLVRNIRNLKQLHLSYVDISSTVPSFLANFSSLTSLLLRDCELQGFFTPVSMGFQRCFLAFLFGVLASHVSACWFIFAR